MMPPTKSTTIKPSITTTMATTMIMIFFVVMS